MQIYLLLIFFVLILNLIRIDNCPKKKFILPLSFLAIFSFIGFRYDYGTDYLKYMVTFYFPENYGRDMSREPLFWAVMLFFKKYYQFILFQAFAICFTYYYFVRKYLTPNYYFLFFLLFLTSNGLFFSNMAAERTCFAGIAFLWGTEFFFLKQYKPIFWGLSIIVAYLFHHVAIQLLIVLLMYKFAHNISPKVFALIIITCLIISMTSITSYVSYGLSLFSEDSISGYSVYLGEKFTDSNLSHTIVRLFILIPGYFIYKEHVPNYGIDSVKYKFACLSSSFMVVEALNMNFQQRTTILLFVFVIISFIYLFEDIQNRSLKYIITGLFVFYILWQTYVMFVQLQDDLFQSGNFWFYHTIFEESQLP